MSCEFVTVSAQNIFDLNNHKEYTLTATPILEKVLTDTRICSTAAKLWQFLFSKSKYNNDLSLKISYSRLASVFNKSVRTIARWIKSLVTAGYLLIRHNFDKDGNQIINTIMVRIPQDVFQYAQQAKDRKTKNTILVSNELYKNSSDIPSTDTLVDNGTCSLNKGENVHQPSVEFSADVDFSEITEYAQYDNTLTEILPVYKAIEYAPDEKITQNHKENVASENLVVPIIELDDKPQQQITLSQNRESDEVDYSPDKNVMGRGDNNDSYILIAKDVIKNNIKVESNDSAIKNPVVNEWSIENIDKTITQIQTCIDKELVLLKDALERHKTENTLTQQAEIMEKTGKMKTQINYLQMKKEQTLAEAIKTREINEKENFLAKDITSIFNAKGERMLSGFTLKRLITAIIALGYSNKALNTLVNEIVFEVRFGALKQGKQGEVLNTEKAVNIGIKLVRENRWNTPSALQDFVPILIANK